MPHGEHTPVADAGPWPWVPDLTGPHSIAEASGEPIVGAYRLVERIGRGGMAEVHRAVPICDDDDAGASVAVKVLRHELAEEPGFAALFLREAAIAARLVHPNIVRLFDVGSGPPHLVMELVQGRSLRQVLAAAPGSRVGLPLGLCVVRSLAEALHYAHECRNDSGRPLGLVHRDVSPSNVLIGFDGVVKLADFGIAKSTAQVHTTIGGTLKGKLGYMSPEQCRCERLDRRSDVYCLGILLYEVTLGRRLFGARNEFSVFGQILRGDFQPPTALDPSYPPALERIVLQALQLEPDFRYQSAAQLAAELQQFVEESGLHAGAPQLAAAMRRWFEPSSSHAPQREAELAVPTQIAEDDGWSQGCPVEEIDDDPTVPQSVDAAATLGGASIVVAPLSARRWIGSLSMWLAAMAGALLVLGCFAASYVIRVALTNADPPGWLDALFELLLAWL